MKAPYKQLQAEAIPAGTLVHRKDRVRSTGTLTPDSPALKVMTDLRQVRAICVAQDVVIDDALQRMIFSTVRMLFVTNSSDVVLGIITARDINGKKPLEFASRERVPRSEIQVGHIMTPASQVESLAMADVIKAKVGDVILTLREAGRQHAVVTEQEEDGCRGVCGVFSTTRIGRLLGMEIQPTGRVQSFAELEAVLVL